MRYKLFGRSGLRVSELCLGAMMFGEEWGYGSAKEECRKIFDTFAEGGGNFIDTANGYTDGSSEKMLGEFIASDRSHFVVATKYSMSKPNEHVAHPNAVGNHRKHLVEALEASLNRLNTDYIDVYWVHVWDFLTPVEEVMRGLDDVVRAGKVLYVGICNAPAWIVARANTIAEFRGWTPFIGVQIQYSLLSRTVEREFLPMARELDLGVCCWQPLGGSVLTGDQEELRIRVAASGQVDPSDRELKILRAVLEVAEEVGHSPSQVALNWLRQQKGVVIPIAGARLASHVKDNLACLEWRLTDEQLRRLDKASRIELGYPYEMLRFFAGTLTYGGLKQSLDNHRGWPSYLER